MGGECCMHGREEKWVQILVEILKARRDRFEDFLGINGRIILKLILKK